MGNKNINGKKIKYNFYRIISNFAFGKTKEFLLSKKTKYKSAILPPPLNYLCDNGSNNKYDKEKIEKNKINLAIHGDNNTIDFRFSEIKGNSRKLTINIWGNNNKIVIGKDLTIHSEIKIDLSFSGSRKINNSTIIIGDSFFFFLLEIMLMDDNSKLTIGNDCMFSEKILIRLSDTHAVLDLNGNLLNHGGMVEIGNHVWCGREVRILKNVSIMNDSIIGASSVVTKRFKEANIAIGGNPAKIIKNNINWSKLTPDEYLENQ